MTNSNKLSKFLEVTYNHINWGASSNLYKNLFASVLNMIFLADIEQ